jgi:predicted TIM-barrel fold metal-dependent hydrolase
MAGREEQEGLAMIIDAQVHPYGRRDPNSPGAHAPGAGPLEVNGDQLVAVMDELRIDGAICVSSWGDYHTDTTFAESVYHGHPNRIRLVAPIDTKVPGVAERVSDWRATPGAVGIRLLYRPEHMFTAADAGVAATIHAATSAGLPVNIHCWDRLSLMNDLAQRYPDAQLVIDHLGLTQPLVPPAPEDVLADLPHLLALAGYPNVVVKVSGVCTYSRQPFPYDDLWEPIARVIEAFGIERCMWGTDWTRTTAILTYGQAVRAFRDHWPLSASDRAALMGGTAAQIYNWSGHPDLAW